MSPACSWSRPGGEEVPSALPVPLCSNPAALLFSGFLAQPEGKSWLALDQLHPPTHIPKPVKGQWGTACSETVRCCGCFWLTVSLTDGCTAPLLQEGQLVPALLNRGVGARSAWNRA